MKNKNGNTMKLGMFVSLSIALFIAGIYYVGQKQQLFNDTFHIVGVFKDISGLQVGNNVRFSGINVGIVEDIEQITDSTVKVSMLIDAKTKKFIKKNAKAIIGSDGLMGDKIVLITPGTTFGEQQISENDIIETAQQVNLDDILSKVKVSADNTAVISGQLSEIFVKINRGKGILGQLIQDSAIADNFNQTIVNLKKSTKGIDENVQAAKHNFLFKGYFNRKERAERKKREAENKKDEQQPKDVNSTSQKKKP
jgi:phospholipid/cholesterol/gamma-HCH transport system substrate-binding protein